MKQFVMVDSLNSKAQIRHTQACNWYMRKLAKKHGKRKVLTKKTDNDKMGIKIITIVNKHEIWLKEK